MPRSRNTAGMMEHLPNDVVVALSPGGEDFGCTHTREETKNDTEKEV